MSEDETRKILWTKFEALMSEPVLQADQHHRKLQDLFYNQAPG